MWCHGGRPKNASGIQEDLEPGTVVDIFEVRQSIRSGRLRLRSSTGWFGMLGGDDEGTLLFEVVHDRDLDPIEDSEEE